MAAEAEQLQQFLRDYEKWVRDVLTPTRMRLREIFDDLKKSGRLTGSDGRQPTPTPIHRAFSRVKRPESVVDKILRKPDAFPDGLSLTSIKNMPDALGGRIITYFLSGLPLIHNELVKHPSIQIDHMDPPIAYLDDRLLLKLGLSDLKRSHKESGYSSIHYVVRLAGHTSAGAEPPLIEIQLRTIALDTWAEIEHVLGYKPHKRTSFAVQKQFEIIASQLAAIDEHFNFLYEEQVRYRNEKQIGDSDPLNPENLPPLLSEFGLSCSQHEIDGLLKLLASRGITLVHELRASATRGKIETIKNTYRVYEGREPIDFEIVANIATTGRESDPAQIQKMVEAQIDFLKTWANLKEHVARH